MPVRDLLPLAKVREELKALTCDGGVDAKTKARIERLNIMLRHHQSKRVGQPARQKRYIQRVQADPEKLKAYRARRAFDQQMYLVRKESRQ